MAVNVLPLRPLGGEATLEYGEVKGGSGPQFMVQLNHGTVPARCAVSCLVHPECGDKVLLSSHSQEHYILAVLSRTQSAVELHFSGETTIHSEGALNLRSAQPIHLTSAETLSCVAQNLELTAVKTKLYAQDLTVTAPSLKADHDEVEFRARTVSSWTQRLIQRADTVMRWVEQVETAHIGQLVQHVRQAYLMNSQNAVITARGDVKIDGERIHMG